MSIVFELYAEVDNGIEGSEQESVEIDLNCVENYKEVLSEAAKMMDVDPSIVELVDVHAYASGVNLQTLADSVEWGDLLTEKGGMDVIEDFLALDENNQIIAIHLSNYHGIPLEHGISEIDNSYVQIFGNEDDIINDWIELNQVPERVIWYLNKELIIEDVYPNREMLANGDIIVIER